MTINKPTRFSRKAVTACSAIAVILSCSCREKGEVHHFRTPKTAKQPSAPATGPLASQPAAGTPYTWSLPQGWSAKPASGMRLATIVIPGPSGELSASVTEFGGDLAGNVNRWRGQIGLPPLQESAIMDSLTEVETGLGKGYIVSLANPETPDNALLAAIVPRPKGTSVFVKLPGKIADLTAITPAFTEFTRSLSVPEK